jgi:hypothetical protein
VYSRLSFQQTARLSRSWTNSIGEDVRSGLTRLIVSAAGDVGTFHTLVLEFVFSNFPAARVEIAVRTESCKERIWKIETVLMRFDMWSEHRETGKVLCLEVRDIFELLTLVDADKMENGTCRGLGSSRGTAATWGGRYRDSKHSSINNQ